MAVGIFFIIRRINMTKPIFGLIVAVMVLAMAGCDSGGGTETNFGTNPGGNPGIPSEPGGPSVPGGDNSGITEIQRNYFEGFIKTEPALAAFHPTGCTAVFEDAKLLLRGERLHRN
jgi:hypothetical protein